jgi:hypothetical protein
MVVSGHSSVLPRESRKCGVEDCGRLVRVVTNHVVPVVLIVAVVALTSLITVTVVKVTVTVAVVTIPVFVATYPSVAS